MMSPEFIPTIKSLISKKWGIPEDNLCINMHYRSYHDEIAIITTGGSCDNTSADAIFLCESELENGAWYIHKYYYTDGIFTNEDDLEKEYNADGTPKE